VLFDWPKTPCRKGTGLILIDVPDLGGRVAEILRDPHHYFADASARAWNAATAEIDTELAQRAQYRLNHHKASRTAAPAWLPPTTDAAP
jgi:hypothetical protein